MLLNWTYIGSKAASPASRPHPLSHPTLGLPTSSIYGFRNNSPYQPCISSPSWSWWLAARKGIPFRFRSRFSQIWFYLHALHTIKPHPPYIAPQVDLLFLAYQRLLGPRNSRVTSTYLYTSLTTQAVLLRALFAPLWDTHRLRPALPREKEERGDVAMFGSVYHTHQYRPTDKSKRARGNAAPVYSPAIVSPFAKATIRYNSGSLTIRYNYGSSTFSSNVKLRNFVCR